MFRLSLELCLLTILGECCDTMYYSIFLKHLGMSAKQVGVIWTLQTIISVVSPPFIGAVTDKTRRPKVVLIVLLLSAGFTYAALYFVPREESVLKQVQRPVNNAGKKIHSYVRGLQMFYLESEVS